jgi:hypothetical protein
VKISSDIIDPAVFKLPVNSHAIISVSVDVNTRQDIVFNKDLTGRHPDYAGPI